MEQPDLSRPSLIMAFGGWPDAAEASTQGIDHLIRQLKAKRFAEMDCERFFDFTQSRPFIVAEDGSLEQFRMPSVDFFFHKSARGKNDLIFMRGVEPELEWKTFSSRIIELAREFKVSRIYSLGALYDNLPHTRAPKVSGLVNAVNLKKLLAAHKIAAAIYRGPAAIHAFLLTECSKARIEMVSLWGHPPFYVRPEASPRVCMSLLQALGRLLDIDIDMEELKVASTQTDRVLDRLVADNPQLQSHVKDMEHSYDSECGMDRARQGVDEVIKDVENYLRNEGGKSPQG
ncbi:MAG: PAC2 family protein [Chloroflexi bacterium]|nr:PAC2 family protein [Chloroflexota bacterium]